jgi:hypothetical protein
MMRPKCPVCGVLMARHRPLTTSESTLWTCATIDTLGHGYFNGVGLEFEDDLESGCRQCSGTGFILGRRGLLCSNPIHTTKGEA